MGKVTIFEMSGELLCGVGQSAAGGLIAGGPAKKARECSFLG